MRHLGAAVQYTHWILQREGFHLQPDLTDGGVALVDREGAVVSGGNLVGIGEARVLDVGAILSHLPAAGGLVNHTADAET